MICMFCAERCLNTFPFVMPSETAHPHPIPLFVSACYLKAHAGKGVSTFVICANGVCLLGIRECLNHLSEPESCMI